MTPAEKIQKRLELEAQAWAIQKQLIELKRGCKHEIMANGRLLFSPAKERVVQTDEEAKAKGFSGSSTVYCQICDEDFGWACAKGPKGYCEYDDKHGEDCIYCGQPSERK